MTGHVTDEMIESRFDAIAPTLDDSAWEDVLRRADLDSPRPAVFSPHSRPSRSRSWLIGGRKFGAVIPVAVALVALTAVVLLAPWRSGPGSVNPAEAARVLDKTLAALTPRPGWVFHERVQIDQVVPGTSRRRAGLREVWIVNSPPYRYRQIIVNTRFAGAIETGGTAGSATGSVYDGATKTIFRSSVSGRLTVPSPPLGSWRSSISRDIRAGRARVIGRTTVNGRSAYEIEWLLSQSPIKLYVDASTYAPIKIDFPGLDRLDGYWWIASEHFVAYGYIPPTKRNLTLASLASSHPAARLAPATKMRASLRNRLNPRPPVSNGR